MSLNSNDFSKCSNAEKRRLSELLTALRAPINFTCNKNSFLSQGDFFEEFTSRLLSQHIFLGNPMMQESFDSAFVASAKVSGFKISQASPGQRFWDVQLDGRKSSLKTTKAKGLKAELLHISKLTEAAWIQDCRTAKSRQDQTFELFKFYTNEVSSVFQFRYFTKIQRYELVEISTNILKGVFDVPKDYFSSDGPSINIPIGQDPPDFTLKLDRSDSKITLANIRKCICFVHAQWDLGTSTLKG